MEPQARRDASPIYRPGFAHRLPDYPWLDQSQCFDADVFKTGWKTLVEELLADIDACLGGTSARLELHQIKEKLGSLRFYHRLRDTSGEQEATVARLVKQAYETSLKTCITCGEAGWLTNTQGLLRTACDRHARLRGR